MRSRFTNHQKIKTKLRQAAAFIIALVLANLFLMNNAFGQSQSFTNPANNGTAANQFTVPAGVTSINVTAIGGGGAGGWPSSSNPRNGGGGGALVVGTLTVSPGQVYNVVVGRGGIATSIGTAGGSGTASTLRVNGPNTLVFSASFGTGAANSGGTSGLGGTTGVGGTVTSGSNGGVRNTTTDVGGVGGNSGAGTGGAAPNSSAAANSGGGGGGGNTSGAGGNGGSGIVTITWTIPCGTITASATKNDVTCFNTGTGQITITGSGGTAPYKFSIDNITNYNATVIVGASYVPINATSGKFINLPIGTYKIRVKDNNGCESKSVQ
jgi:hypothetical protein